MVVNPRTRLTVALVALAATLFALVPAGPASAHTATVVIEASATFGSGTLGCGFGDLQGTASGSHGGILTSTPFVNAPVSAIFTYCDGVTGTAEGRLSVAGVHSCDFRWSKTGAVATVTSDCNYDGRYDDGTGVAVIIPTTLPGSIPCRALVTYVGDITFSR